MKLFEFHTTKYGQELPMDLGRFEETPHFFFEEPPHTTNFYEMFFFESANGIFELDHQRIPLQDHMVVFASPYQRRSWLVDRNKIKGYYLIFEKQFLSKLFIDPLFVYKLQYFHNHQTPLFIQEDQDAFTRYKSIFTDMLKELDYLESDSEDHLRALLLLTLAYTNRKYATAYNLSPNRKTDTIAFQFKKIVEREIKNIQTVQEFADMLKVNRVLLNKVVKRQFNISASQFIKTQLLTQVKKELLFSNRSLNEIAHTLNFAHASSLIRFFRKGVGISPTQYKNDYHNTRR